MATKLQKTLFSAELQALPEVQAFDCGSEPWETEVSEWIRGGEPLNDMKKRGTKVWLYGTSEGDLVGFGSLGRSNWEWPSQGDPRVPISVIPMVGIANQFKGKPDGPYEGRFSSQILDDLINEARSHPNRRMLLGLYVHPENTRAIRVYERAGFQRFSMNYFDETSRFC